DGTGIENLTNNEYNDYHPRFNNDGSYIVYQSGFPDGTNNEIYVMNLESGEVNNLSNDQYFMDEGPIFVPRN
ncbi:MAG: PD40 domain-containing protein, partial [Candidatus Marinimicrobia bacterium]|nr:PD40 domain-containing protein [Candidatus Neomarinimicrobiota bacterium]